ncbi:MAG TPA: D-glycerate dehydrogenase [Gaiellaceae bacterium]
MKIAATRPLPGPAWDELEDVVFGERPDAEILVVMNEPVAFDDYPQLRLVANFSVGYDNIDVEECRRRGIAVSNTPGVLDAATADLAFGLILAARRRIAEGDRAIRAGGWRLGGPAREVTGATLAVIGMGRIGSAVARRAAGFDMRVVGVRSREGDLDDALREADVVSLHVPLSDLTRGLVSRGRLALLRDGATLVNTARGAVVDEEALVEELASGRINAGLDVFVHEPHVPERLRDLPNVVLTPHIASATVETRAAMTRVVVDNVLAFERGEPLLNPVM